MVKYKLDDPENRAILLACTSSIGLDVHKIFLTRNPKKCPADTRFILRFKDLAVKQGEVNSYEILYLLSIVTAVGIQALSLLRLGSEI